MKILVTCPFLTRLGGVANHYLGLKPYWKENVKYLETGSRGSKSNKGKYWLIVDIFRLVIKILSFNPDCVLLNPSIGMNALKRDFLFQDIANSLGKPTAIFIHGFDLQVFQDLNLNWLAKKLNKSKIIFVLAEDFKQKLITSGVTTPIIVTTTKVDDNLLRDFDIKTKDGKKGNLLFLARVEKAKGIHETLDIFKILQKDYPNIKLNIVGDGPELPIIKERISKEKIENVLISGRLSGPEISQAYKSALLFLMLTHGEGMPTTVLEAMAFGLPVITRPVGGLVDFFENGKMGYIDKSLDQDKIADGIRLYLDNSELTIEVGKYNHEYAKNRFMASMVAKNLESYLKTYIIDRQN